MHTLDYAFIYSKIILPENVSGNPRHGFEFNLGYNCLLKNNWGFGVRYARYSTSLTGTINGTTLTDLISLQHFGPGVTLQTVKRRWTIGGALGLGYAYYQEKMQDLKSGVGGFGVHISFNAEYMLGRQVGQNINISKLTVRFNSEKFGGGQQQGRRHRHRPHFPYGRAAGPFLMGLSSASKHFTPATATPSSVPEQHRRKFCILRPQTEIFYG